MFGPGLAFSDGVQRKDNGARSPGSGGSSFVPEALAVFLAIKGTSQFVEPVRPGDPPHPGSSLSWVISRLLPGEEKPWSLL